MASVWIPLAARLTPANEADNIVAELLVPEFPHQTRFVLGDRHYNAPNVKQACRWRNLFLVTTQYGLEPRIALRIDPAVIGGLRVQIGEDVIDGTVASRLADLRLQLAG